MVLPFRRRIFVARILLSQMLNQKKYYYKDLQEVSKNIINLKSLHCWPTISNNTTINDML